MKTTINKINLITLSLCILISLCTVNVQAKGKHQNYKARYTISQKEINKAKNDLIQDHYQNSAIDDKKICAIYKNTLDNVERKEYHKSVETILYDEFNTITEYNDNSQTLTKDGNTCIIEDFMDENGVKYIRMYADDYSYIYNFQYTDSYFNVCEIIYSTEKNDYEVKEINIKDDMDEVVDSTVSIQGWTSKKSTTSCWGTPYWYQENGIQAKIGCKATYYFSNTNKTTNSISYNYDQYTKAVDKCIKQWNLMKTHAGVAITTAMFAGIVYAVGIYAGGVVWGEALATYISKVVGISTSSAGTAFKEAIASSDAYDDAHKYYEKVKGYGVKQ